MYYLMGPCVKTVLYFRQRISTVGIQESFVITDNNSEFICDKEFDDIRDGKWVISIDGEITIRDITRLPGGRIFVEGGNRAFECKIEDIEIIGKIISLTVKYVKQYREEIMLGKVFLWFCHVLCY